MNAEEFLYNYRLTRESFALFLDKIKDHPVFKKKSNASKKSGNKKGKPVELQLLVFLCRIGREGSGGSSRNVADHFGIGLGSVRNYVKKVIVAIKSLEKEVIVWPDDDEREKMKKD
jgi:hypothetical protein